MNDIPPLPSLPPLDSDIHVWCASLNVSPQELSYYSSLLSQDEVVRAARFVYEKDRHHFIVGRGLLRVILSKYLQFEPAQLEFIYGPYGKPALKPGSHGPTLEFNLSHSEGLVLYAIGSNRRIGIDVEHIHPMPDMDNFAEHFFSRNECALINRHQGQKKEDAFFKIWTTREAFLKANGSGLAAPPNQIEITLGIDGTVEFTQIGNDISQAKNWHLEILNPAPGYQAALVFDAHAGRVIFHKFN